MDRRAIFIAVFLIAQLANVFAFGQEPVQFDVPAIVEAIHVNNDCVVTPDDPYESLIEIVVPVSSSLAPAVRDAFTELQVEVFWNDSVYPVIDFSPDTLMQSPVNGTIAVEKRNDHAVKVGGNATAPTPAVTVGASAESTNNSGTMKRYEEIPESELLVASGTINRGTGAFFRFHPSRQFTLEGNRDVSIICRVPKTWRAGVLRVDCTVRGNGKGFAGSKEALNYRSTFIVPVHLRGDHDARGLAVSFVRNEQAFRSAWSHYLQNKTKPTLIEQISKSFKNETGNVPDNWDLQVIQASSTPDLAETSSKLPSSIRTAAKQFVDARSQLAQLNRTTPMQ
ncbi:MAG: hypothetical protein R3C03_18775 [Pirellulaceae bacterium]